MKFDSYLEDMSVNFYKGLEGMRNVANNWIFSNLTICGKITVTNELVLSKISHIVSVLPTPSKTIFNSFVQLIYEFIKGKKGTQRPA